MNELPIDPKAAAFADLLADFDDETSALDELVAPLDENGWSSATPAEGWSILDQISHLAGFDESARVAVVDPDAFVADLADRMDTGRDPIAEYTEIGRSKSGAEALSWWRDARDQFRRSLTSADPSLRVPWYGPPMSLMSHVTARVMEAWAHGQDIRDTLGVAPLQSRRLRHVAHIGFGARGFSYAVNGWEAPTIPVAVRLNSPSGSSDALWTWGPDDCVDVVSGDALDFCLLVTQRRHLDDVDLVVEGAEAERWMSVAQAFAGSAGGGRASGQFS